MRPLTANDFRVHVGDLLHAVGSFRDVRRSVVVHDLAAAGARVPVDDTVDLDLRLEAIGDGIVVSGDVSGRWTAECSRCLEAVEGPFELVVRELFEDEPVESETYPLLGEEIDLEPLIRDAVLPEIPTAPLCDEECRGLCPQCGIDRNHERCSCATDARDPRWSALDELRFDDR